MTQQVLHALSMAFAMFWEILWALILGFGLSAVVQRRMVDQARRQADRGLAGKMEGHAAMDMSVTGGGTIWQRIGSPKGFTAISHYFVMDWVAVWKDIAGGLLIAGALGAWVPATWWNRFFLTNHPQLAQWWGPVAGPIVAILSFVCSIGNVPLAAILWNGGSSFGGVVAFIFADLIVLPLLNIYRKYYGAKMSAFLLVTMFASMSGAALRGRVCLPGVALGSTRASRANR